MSDRFANIVFVCACLLLTVFVGMRVASPKREATAREGFLSVGSQDPFGLPPSDRARGRLYVFVSSDCPVCDAELPFYRALAERARRPGLSTSLVFVSMDPIDTLRPYLQQAGVGQVTVVTVIRPAGIPGSPCVVLLDGQGKVERSWAGRLNRRQKRDIEAILTR